jgi:hypothetical protein
MLSSWSGNQGQLTEKEEELMRQDDEAKHFCLF